MPFALTAWWGLKAVRGHIVMSESQAEGAVSFARGFRDNMVRLLMLERDGLNRPRRITYLERKLQQARRDLEYAETRLNTIRETLA